VFVNFTAKNEKILQEKNLNFGAVCENKGSRMAKGGMAIRINTEVPRGDGNNGTIVWKDTLNKH
jgi:hypothetical protein